MIKKMLAAAAAFVMCLASAAHAQTFGGAASALNSMVSITSANGSNPVSFETAAGYGQKVTGLMCNFRQGTVFIGTAQTLELSILHGGTSYFVGQVIMPANAGNVATAGQINLLQQASGTTNLPFAGLQTDSDGNNYIPIAVGDALQIRPVSAVAAGNTFNCFATGQKY